MKCPLPVIIHEMDSFPPGGVFRDCLEEGCAWWDQAVKRCVVQNISEKMSMIYLELTSIRTQGE